MIFKDRAASAMPALGFIGHAQRHGPAGSLTLLADAGAQRTITPLDKMNRERIAAAIERRVDQRHARLLHETSESVCQESLAAHLTDGLEKLG